MKNFETWLPLFVGFYETYLNGDDDINNYLDGEDNLNYDNLDIDFKAYQLEVVKWLVTKINKLLKDELDINCSIKLQELISPKFYNFETDSINISIDITQKELNKISVLINDNFDAIQTIIKDDYTNRDGFNSFHSNNINDWETLTSNWNDFSDNAHYLGKVLEMLLQVSIDNVTEDNVADDIMNDFLESGVTLSEYIMVKE